MHVLQLVQGLLTLQFLAAKQVPKTDSSPSCVEAMIKHHSTA